MADRKLYWEGDILLDPQQHPKGSRLILSDKSDPVKPYEVTVLEWAPSNKRVLLQYPESRQWTECWDYKPVVIEALIPTVPNPDGERVRCSLSATKTPDIWGKSHQCGNYTRDITGRCHLHRDHAL